MVRPVWGRRVLRVSLEISSPFPILCLYTKFVVITASIARMAGVPLLHISTGKRSQVELVIHVE